MYEHPMYIVDGCGSETNSYLQLSCFPGQAKADAPSKGQEARFCQASSKGPSRAAERMFLRSWAACPFA